MSHSVFVTGGIGYIGLIEIDEILNALVWAVENLPNGVQIVDVPRIRDLNRSFSARQSK